MTSSPSHTVKGSSLWVGNTQVAFKKGTRIKISILHWIDDRRLRYEIQVLMPWGKIYTLSSYVTSKGAFKAHKRIVEQFKNGTAKIEIGDRFRIVSVH